MEHGLELKTGIMEMNEEKQSTEGENKLVLFQSKAIRRLWFDEEWYYSVVDIVGALSDSPTPRQYWGKVKEREFNKIQLSPIWVRLRLWVEHTDLVRVI